MQRSDEPAVRSAVLESVACLGLPAELRPTPSCRGALWCTMLSVTVMHTTPMLPRNLSLTSMSFRSDPWSSASAANASRGLHVLLAVGAPVVVAVAVFSMAVVVVAAWAARLLGVLVASPIPPTVATLARKGVGQQISPSASFGRSGGHTLAMGLRATFLAASTTHGATKTLASLRTRRSHTRTNACDACRCGA